MAKVIICDICKKILKKDDITYFGLGLTQYEVCSECHTKLEPIKLKYESKFDKLDNERRNLRIALYNEIENLLGDINNETKDI